MTPKITIPTLTKDQRIWLNAIYPGNISGERFSFKDIWSKLYKKLPSSFRPVAMDSSLVSGDGCRILLLGIVGLERSAKVIKEADTIIKSIRSRMLADSKLEKILVTELSTELNLQPGRISLILYGILWYGRFYRTTISKDNSDLIEGIDLVGDDNVYYQYLDFPGMAALITQKTNEQFRLQSEPFSVSEITEWNAKLDEILQEIRHDIGEIRSAQEAGLLSLKAGQEVIYTDVIQEVQELKALYPLGKKTWRQVLIGKVAEMTVSGIVSETVSKHIIELIRSLADDLLIS